MRRTRLLAAGLGVPLSLALMIPGGALAAPGGRPGTPASGSAFFLTDPSSAPEESWAGTCRQPVITLEDGTQHRADVRFEA